MHCRRGINSGHTIKAAFDLGAAAVQVGTLFIGTDESEAIPSYKLKLDEAKDTDSQLTKLFQEDGHEELEMN